MNTRPFLSLHKCISVLVHIYILVYYYSMAIIMKCPASKFFLLLQFFFISAFILCFSRWKLKSSLTRKKNLEFCRIMFRSPVLGYEKVKCTEMHFKKKFVLICFFFHWLGLLSSCQIIQKRKKKENGLRSSTIKIEVCLLRKLCKPIHG